METGHLSTRAVNSGSGNRALLPVYCSAFASTHRSKNLSRFALHSTKCYVQNHQLTAVPSAAANFSAEAFRFTIPARNITTHNTTLSDTKPINAQSIKTLTRAYFA